MLKRKLNEMKWNKIKFKKKTQQQKVMQDVRQLFFFCKYVQEWLPLLIFFCLFVLWLASKNNKNIIKSSVVKIHMILAMGFFFFFFKYFSSEFFVVGKNALFLKKQRIM